MTFSQILRNGYFLGIVVFFATVLQSTLKQASTHVLCVGGIRLRTALQVFYYCTTDSKLYRTKYLI